MACLTFPLIWMGGFVTTYDAGMAVPDWPNTYGYNLFLYPLASWLGVWDVFLEHSHRLLGAAVGTVAIVLAALLWRSERLRWLRWWGVAAVVGVSLQGTLGGLRVIGNEVLLADIHGCTAPLFFAFTVVLVILTSQRWAGGSDAPPAFVQRLAGVTALGTWLQIVLGAQVRHVPQGIRLGPFLLWVWLHVIVAAFVVAAITWLVWKLRRNGSPFLVRRAWLLASILVVQLALGIATWVVNYGWPRWFTDYVWHLNYTVVAGGPLQAVVTTAHVAFGSLTLAAAVTVAVWTRRSAAPAIAPTGLESRHA